MLLIAVWAMLWLSQAYAGCCEPHARRHHTQISPAMEIHAIVRSENEGCDHPQEPTCPQTLVEKLPIASAQIGAVADGKLTQVVLRKHAPRMPVDTARSRNDRAGDPPLATGRAYLLLQRLLI